MSEIRELLIGYYLQSLELRPKMTALGIVLQRRALLKGWKAPTTVILVRAVILGLYF